MLIPLAVPFVEASAAALSWSLGAPEQDALCGSEIALDDLLPGARLELRVLGASHQVRLRCPHDDGAPALSEVVACLPGRPGGLPGRHEQQVGRARYDFTSTVHRADAAGTARAVDDLLARLVAVPDALVGVFPGRRHAVTAVEPTRGAVGGEVHVGWTTWHTYPEAGEVVRTTTRLRLAAVHGDRAHPAGTCTVCDDPGEVVGAAARPSGTGTTRGAP